MAAEKKESYQPGGHGEGHGGGPAAPTQESIDLLTKLLLEFQRRPAPADEELPPEVKRDIAAMDAIVESLQNAVALRPSAMTITRLSEKGGPGAGGTRVTITGTRLLPGSTVLFGNLVAENINVVSQTEVQVTTPPGKGSVDVVVSTIGGSARMANAFTYHPESR